MSDILNKFLDSGIDATKIADGSVSNAEFQYIGGLTSDAQTQLTAKAIAARNINTAANSGLAGGGDLSADRSLAVDVFNAATVSAASGDYVLIADVSDSNALKKVLISDIVAMVAGENRAKETIVLSGTNITNQYVDLAQLIKPNSLSLMVKGAGAQLEGASYDYTLSTEGGVTRVTWLNALLADLVATDVLQIQYEY